MILAIWTMLGSTALLGLIGYYLYLKSPSVSYLVIGLFLVLILLSNIYAKVIIDLIHLNEETI